MKTKRNIAICGLTLVMCVSLLAGVTFAWFTDSITNSGNTISSGDLKINAYAYDLGEGGESYTINETVYSFEADENRQNLKEDNEAVITAGNWYPGQSSAKMFTVENVGSLDAAVSLDFFVSGGLTEALWFDFIQVGADGSVMGQFVERPMETLPALAEALGDVEIASNESISFVLIYGMEKEAQNEYMNQSFQVNVFISAKQTVEGAEGPVVVNPGTDLSEVVNSVADNSTIVLAANGEYEVKDAIDLSGKKGIVIDGNGATITMGTEESGASYSLAKAALAETKSNSGEESILNIAGAENVIIRNLTVEGAVKHGINLYKSVDVLIENVVAKDNGALGICVNASEVTLKNVTTSGNAWGGVNVDNKVGEVTLTVDEACSFGEYLQIYADSEEIGLAINVNLPEKYTAIKLSIPVGEFVAERYLWTTDAVVTNATELSTAVAAGGNVIFANDIESSNLSYFFSDISVNLNTFTFNYTGSGLAVMSQTDVEFLNGNITSNSLVFGNSAFSINKGASLTMNQVVFNCNSVGLFPNGDAAKVEVLNSKIYATLYAIGTNAASASNYNVDISVKDSYLETTYNTDNDGGSITIFVNVPSSLNIENSEIVGVQNAVMVRGGTATINDSKLSTVADIEEEISTFFTDEPWKSGNFVPFGTLLVGNRENSSYNYAANVTLENCELISNNEEVPAIYIWGNATEANGATLTFDKATYDKMQGNIDGDLNGEQSNVTINYPEEITAVATFEEFVSAVKSKSLVLLTKDLKDISVNTEINGNDVVVDLNGKSIFAVGEHSASLAFYVLRAKNCTLIVKNGTIDATEVVGRFDGLVANGNSNLTIQNVNIYSVDGCVTSSSQGNNLKIENCILEAQNYYAVYQNGSESPCLIEIYDSSIIGGVYISNANIAGREKQTLKIDNCYISGQILSSGVGTALEVKHTNATVTNTILVGVGELASREYGNGGCTNGFALAVTTNSASDYATGDVVLSNCTLLYKESVEATETDGSYFVYTMEDSYNTVINGTTVTEFNQYDE